MIDPGLFRRLGRGLRRMLAIAAIILAVAFVTTVTVDLGPALRQLAEKGGAAYLKRDFTIANNLILDLHDKAPYSSRGVLKPSVINESAEKNVEHFDIRTTSINLTAGSLSGGNQQKVVLARELSRPLKLLIASNPTRGLDVGSIEFVHKRIIQERDSGAAVIIVSDARPTGMHASAKLA